MFDEVGIYDDHLIEAEKEINQIFFSVTSEKKNINKRQTMLGKKSALEVLFFKFCFIFDIWNIDMSTVTEMGRKARICKNEGD